MKQKLLNIISNEIMKMSSISIKEYAKIIEIVSDAITELEKKENEEFLEKLLEETRPKYL